MRPVTVILSVLALLFITAFAGAAPPVLKPSPATDLPTEVREGVSEPFTVTYQQSQGDAPKNLYLVVQTPSGSTVRANALAPAGDPTSGEEVTWNYLPLDSGTYHYHFEVTSATGATARYPAAEDLQFVSVSLVSKYVIFAVGLLVALFFLPFVVYMATRSLNKRSDPAAAARIGLLIGVLASFGLYLYLFWSVYGGLGTVIAAIAALGVLIALFSRRRVA